MKEITGRVAKVIKYLIQYSYLCFACKPSEIHPKFAVHNG